MAQLRGKSGKVYEIDQQLASGGEGTVYTVKGDSTIVIKQYHAKALSSNADALEKKLTAMVNDTNFNSYNDGALRFAWPMDLVYDMNSKFAGFVMPYAKNTYEFHQLMWPDKREQFKRYDYMRSIAVSYNLAQAVKYVHDNGYVLGDMNIKNFRFDNMCRVIVLDVDSFDLTNKVNDPRCKCCVGIAEYLAPELQGIGDLSRPSARFTRESDYFSMALLIFKFLMDGTHPFNAPRITNVDGYSSSAGAVASHPDIVNGNCPFVREGTGKMIPPYAPDYAMLPANLRELFRRTFAYTQATAMQSIPNRATAEEFLVVLFQFFDRKDKVICSADSKHIYLSRLKKCPFCERDDKQSTGTQQTAAASSQTAATQNVSSKTTPAQPAQPAQPAPKTGWAKVTDWFKDLFS